MSLVSTLGNYDALVRSVGLLLQEGRKRAFKAVNNILVQTYWRIGQLIVEYEQKGSDRAKYGSSLLQILSKELKFHYGSGFSMSNVYAMRLFYLKYRKFQTVSGKLSWSHYAELLGVEDDFARWFYEKQCLNDGWSVRELKRQVNSALFHRLALSKDKVAVLKLSNTGKAVEQAEDVIKDPYVFEFLGLPEKGSYLEKELEQRLIDNLQMFLLELGKGFAFVQRQYRITLDNAHYYVDLVFYHRILKCFVLIDLKVGRATHQDVGQMNRYLNYFKSEENSEADTSPIGIILSAEKNGVLVKYALGGITNRLFVSKYQLYLPDKKQLEASLRNAISKRSGQR